jgi:hypothetical protein
MLISNEFRSVATQDHNLAAKFAAIGPKRLAGSNVKEVEDAKTVNNLPQREQDFPKLLLEEEDSKAARIR